jgi:hypothetical protein
MTDQISEIVESKGLSFDQCRGQGYDGASTMSGAYFGVQKFIHDMQPLTVYVHCAAHNLNLSVCSTWYSDIFCHNAGTVRVLSIRIKCSHTSTNADHLKTEFDDMSEYRNKFEDAVDEAICRLWNQVQGKNV